MNIELLNDLIISHFSKLNDLKKLITKQTDQINLLYDESMDLTKYLTDIQNYLKPSLDEKTLQLISLELDKMISDLKQNLELYQVVKNKIINIKKQINKLLIDEEHNIDEEQKNKLHNLLEILNQKQKAIDNINTEITNIENKDEYLNKLYFFEINEELNEKEINKRIKNYEEVYDLKNNKKIIDDSNIQILNNLIDNINEIQFHKLNDIHKYHIKDLKEKIKIKLDWNNLASYINRLYYFEINIQYPLIIKKYDNFKNIDEKEVLNRLDELYNLIDETYNFIANYESILSNEIINNLKTIKNIHDIKNKIPNDFEIKLKKMDTMHNFINSFKSKNEKISYIKTYIQNYNDLKTSIQNKIIELDTNYEDKFNINHIIIKLEILITEINRKIYNLDLDIQSLYNR